jgi:hypothetical protein
MKRGLALASAYPWRQEFALAHALLRRAAQAEVGQEAAPRLEKTPEGVGSSVPSTCHSGFFSSAALRASTGRSCSLAGTRPNVPFSRPRRST